MLYQVSEFLLPGTADVPLTGWACTGALQNYLGDIAWCYFTSTQWRCLVQNQFTIASLCCHAVWILYRSLAQVTCLPHHPSPVSAGDVMVGTSLGEWETWLNSLDSKTVWVDMQKQMPKKCLLLYMLSQQTQAHLHPYCCKCRGKRHLQNSIKQGVARLNCLQHIYYFKMYIKHYR